MRFNMEQILIVGDDSEVNEDNEMQHEEQHNYVNEDNNIDIGEIKQIIDYLCKLYVVDRKGIEGAIGKINNSITARYVITAITILRSSSSIKHH